VLGHSNCRHQPSTAPSFQDVALAGFNDIATASFVSPPLTTVLQDTGQAGTALIDSLLA